MRAQILVYGKVTASCLNVRCGPGISYNRVGKLYKGDYVDVFAKVGGWYIIKADDDLVGAVSSDYLEAVYNEEERYSNVEQESSEEMKSIIEKLLEEEKQRVQRGKLAKLKRDAGEQTVQQIADIAQNTDLLEGKQDDGGRED